MMFEDFKRVFPDCYLVYSCPNKFSHLAENHPFIDEYISSEEVNPSDYLCYYNITAFCNRYEMRLAPMGDKNRSDIWANHCGVLLTKHNMHLNLTDEQKNFGKKTLERLNVEGKPALLFCPNSAMLGKNLKGGQIKEVVSGLRDMGLFIYSTHSRHIDEFGEMEVPIVADISLRKWMGVVDAADYVISVDTAHFHLAGGLGKPMVGVFAWTDGKIYGKYYNFILVQKHRDNGDWDCGPCYAWTACPKEKHDKRKPCIKEITSRMILDACEEMISKHSI